MNDTYAEIGDADDSNSTGVTPEGCVQLGPDVSDSSLSTPEYGDVIPEVIPSVTRTELVADCLSELLQGSLFRVHRILTGLQSHVRTELKSYICTQKVNFDPTEQGLHVLSCVMHFGIATDITDNGAETGLAMYHMYSATGHITHSGPINEIEFIPLAEQRVKRTLDVHPSRSEKGTTSLVHGIEQRVKRTLDVHPSRSEKDMTGLVHSNLPNNIYQDRANIVRHK